MKLIKLIGEHLPFLFVAVLGIVSAVVGDYNQMRFWIVLALFYVVIRNLNDIKEMLKDRRSL